MKAGRLSAVGGRKSPKDHLMDDSAVAIARAQQSETKRIELDEAVGVRLVVDRVFLERDVALAVERIRARAPDHNHIALIELQPDRAGNAFLALVDQRL